VIRKSAKKKRVGNVKRFMLAVMDAEDFYMKLNAFLV